MKTIKSCTTKIIMSPIEFAKKLGIDGKVVDVKYVHYSTSFGMGHSYQEIQIMTETVTDDE